MIGALIHKAENQGHRKKNARRPFGDLGQGVARTRAKQRVRRAAAKGHARARVLLGQLNQHQQNQQQRS